MAAEHLTNQVGFIKSKRPGGQIGTGLVAYLKVHEHDIWINGVRADQSATRKAMQVEQPAPHNTMRFHPMLDWTSKMIYEYQKEFNLPRHKLESQGYLSIGCEPCTRKFDLEMQEREARWFGMNKTECGLHTALINK